MGVLSVAAGTGDLRRGYPPWRRSRVETELKLIDRSVALANDNGWKGRLTEVEIINERERGGRPG